MLVAARCALCGDSHSLVAQSFRMDDAAAELLQRLPDEIITVIGNHLPCGDLQCARLVSRRWRELLRGSHAHLVVRPYTLAAAAQQPAAASSGGAATTSSAARPRRATASYMAPTPADRRQPPTCLQPPPLQHLHLVFPSSNRVSMRLLSRIGQRGLGITARTDRLTELFDSLAQLGDPRPANGALAPHVHDGGGGGGGGGGAGGSGGSRREQAPFLEVSIIMDIDVPRARHREAHAAATELAQLVGSNLPRLGRKLKCLRFQWYDARLALMAGLPTCLAGLPALQRLELPMTPGALLPALSALVQLTSLKVAAVGDVLHMQDLGVPRHTEVSHLSSLTALQELHLDGWACEMTLVKALIGISTLKALNLGDDLSGAAQSLPMEILTRLTALTTPVSINVTATTSTPAPPAATDHPTSPSRPPQTTVRAGPCMLLPRLQVLHGPPPMARLTSHLPGAPPPSTAAAGSNSTAAAATANGRHENGSAAAVAPLQAIVLGGSGCSVPAGDLLEGAQEQVAGVSGGTGAVRDAALPGGEGLRLAGLGLERMAAGARAQGFSGAARRRALAPSVVTPWLRSLMVELNPVPAAHAAAELGVGEALTCLTRLHARIVAVAEDDLAVVQPILEAAARGAFPRLKELQLQLTRAGLVSPAAMLAALPQCAPVLGQLTTLTSLQLTGLWDGLVPEGWDYSTKGALGGMPGQRFLPSGLSPLKHLSFLRCLPALTSLHLHTDRCRLSLLPPTLTSLTLEGLVHIDASPALPSSSPSQPTSAPAALGAVGTSTPSGKAAATPSLLQQQEGGMTGERKQGREQRFSGGPTPPPPAPLPPQRGSGGGAGVGSTGRRQQRQQQRSGGGGAGEAEVVWAGAGTGAGAVVGSWEEHQRQLVCPSLKKLSVLLAKHPRTVPCGHDAQPRSGAAGTPANAPPSKVPTRGAYCVLDSLRPVLSPSLTSLSYSATPAPSLTRLEHLTPASYGIDRLVAMLAPAKPTHAANPNDVGRGGAAGAAVTWAGGVGGSGAGAGTEGQRQAVAQSVGDELGRADSGGVRGMEVEEDCGGAEGRGGTPGLPTDWRAAAGVVPMLPKLQSLQLYVMPRHAWLIDCRQLSPLSALGALRCLNLESPLTGATRLVCLTALSALTQLTRVVTGRLDDEAYDGKICVSGCSAAQRSQALSWLSGLVAGRFGALPVPAATPSVAPHAPGGAGAGSSAAHTPAPGARGRSTCSPSPPATLPEAAPVAGDVAPGGATVAAPAAAAAGGEEEIGALVGSDVEVHSEDLLFDSAEGEDVGTDDEDVALYSDEEEDEEQES